MGFRVWERALDCFLVDDMATARAYQLGTEQSQHLSQARSQMTAGKNGICGLPFEDICRYQEGFSDVLKVYKVYCRVSGNCESLFGGPYNQDSNMLRSILRVPPFMPTTKWPYERNFGKLRQGSPLVTQNLQNRTFQMLQGRGRRAHTDKGKVWGRRYSTPKPNP